MHLCLGGSAAHTGTRTGTRDGAVSSSWTPRPRAPTAGSVPGAGAGAGAAARPVEGRDAAATRWRPSTRQPRATRASLLSEGATQSGDVGAEEEVVVLLVLLVVLLRAELPVGGGL